GERGGGRVARAGRLPPGQLGERARRGDPHGGAALAQRPPAEGPHGKQPGPPGLGLGEQEGAAAEPGVTVPPRRIGGRRELGDAVQVQVSPPCPGGQCSSSSPYAALTTPGRHRCPPGRRDWVYLAPV